MCTQQQRRLAAPVYVCQLGRILTSRFASSLSQDPCLFHNGSLVKPCPIAAIIAALRTAAMIHIWAHAI